MEQHHMTAITTFKTFFKKPFKWLMVVQELTMQTLSGLQTRDLGKNFLLNGKILG